MGNGADDQANTGEMSTEAFGLRPAYTLDATAGRDTLTLAQEDDLYLGPEIASVLSRAGSYLDAGAPVHFRGPAGVGKTTLALHIAAQRGRPVLLVTGDAWHTAAHLIGDHVGQKTDLVHDSFIHNVKKTKGVTSAVWEDRALTIAMEEGYTLVYDEFTRSPPEANNPLLAALEERVLVLPTQARRERVVRAHPEFRALLTSNPADYAGVSAPQDALIDRMITFDLGWMSPETEAGVVSRRSGMAAEGCRRIVALVRALREEPDLRQPPSMRAAIMIARVAHGLGVAPSAADPRFVQLCMDVLESRAPHERDAGPSRERALEALQRRILETCPAPAGGDSANRSAQKAPPAAARSASPHIVQHPGPGAQRAEPAPLATPAAAAPVGVPQEARIQ
ncbi:MAG: gas vesicle protein GvpN [Pseudomonadota bacterium]